LYAHLQKLKYLIAAFIVVLVACSIPSFLTFNGKKESIQQNLKNIASYNFRIDGDVKISLLPMPKISLGNVTAEDENGDTIQINKLVVHPSIMSVFSDKIQIKKIAIHDAELNLSDIKPLKSSQSDSAIAIPNFELVNTTVTFDNEVGADFKVKNINARFNFAGVTSKDLVLVSNFALGQNRYSFDASFKNINATGDTDDAKFSFYNNLVSLNFIGKLGNLFNKPQLDGKMAFAIKADSSDSKANKFAQIAARDNLKSSADILITDSLISVSNFIINSNSITNGRGELEWLFGFEQEIDANISFDKINIDTLFPKVEGEKEEVFSSVTLLDNVIRPLINEFGADVRSQIFGGLNASINEILYNGQKIENIAFNMDVYNGDLALNHFKLSAPGKASYLLNGNMSFNDVRPRFEGNSTLKVDDLVEFAKWLEIPLSDKLEKQKPKLQFTSKVDLIPRSLRLSAIKFILGDTNIIGKAAFKDTGEKRLNTKLTLRINELNTNDYELAQGVDELITQLYLNDKDKSGSRFIEYVKDYRWLRTFPLNLHAELLIDKAVYKDKNFTEVHSAFRIAPNNFTIDNLGINSDIIKVDGSIGMALTAIKPNITIDLNVKDIDLNIFTSLFPSRESLNQILVAQVLKSYEPSKDAPVEKINAVDKQAIINQQNIFNFYGINNFNCGFKINVDQIRNNTIPILNMNADGLLNEGAIVFNLLKLNIFEGQLETKGSVSIASSVPNINFSYAINNFNPKSALDYFYDLDNFKGYMSANGSIAGSGYNMPMLLSSLKGNINFIGKKIDFTGMDLNEVIRITESAEPLNVRMDKLRNSSMTGDTLFDDVAGNIVFEKGIASLANMSLSTNRSRGFYSANIDYINKLISGRGKISFIPIGTATPINIDVDNKGKLENQIFATNVDEVVKFLQSRLGAAEAAKAQEDKAQSLLRNRKL
jgi:hypothetical protein